MSFFGNFGKNIGGFGKSGELGIFGKKECNTGRQMFVDVAKVAAIVFMVADHCMMYGGADVEQGLALFVDGVLGGGPAAPVFMGCMGIGVAYSRRNDAGSLARRGLI